MECILHESEVPLMNILRNVSLLAFQVSGFSLYYICRASFHVLQECSMHENAYVCEHAY